MFENNSWVYYFALVVCVFCALIMYQRRVEYSIINVGTQEKRPTIIYTMVFIMVGYIVFWAAIRNGVADTAAYIGKYKSLSTKVSLKDLFALTDTDKAPLFTAFQILLKKMGFSWQGYLIIVAVISGVCIYYGISRYSDNIVLSYYLFITGLYYMWLYNGMRQFLVASIIFASFRWIVEKKFWRFAILIFLLYFIHKTAWILIPIYFIANMKNWSYGIYVFILATMAIVVLFPNQLVSILNDTYTEYNVTESFSQDDGVNVLRFLVAMVTPMLALIFKDKIASFENPYVNVMVNLSLISAGLYAVGVVTSGIYIGRLPLFADIFGIILLPFILKNVLPASTKRPIWFACILLYFIYFYLQAKPFYYTTNVFPSMDMGGAQL